MNKLLIISIIAIVIIISVVLYFVLKPSKQKKPSVAMLQVQSILAAGNAKDACIANCKRNHSGTFDFGTSQCINRC